MITVIMSYYFTDRFTFQHVNTADFLFSSRGRFLLFLKVNIQLLIVNSTSVSCLLNCQSMIRY